MALMTCSKCGKEYSDKAAGCPVCNGYDKTIDSKPYHYNDSTNEYAASSNTTEGYKKSTAHKAKTTHIINMRRLKVVVAVYVAVVVLLCIFVPMNTYFQVEEEYFSRYADAWQQYEPSDTVINYGLRYRPVWQSNYSEQIEADNPGILEGRFRGIWYHEPNIFILIMEFVALSVLFAGITFIACVKKDMT